MVGFEVVVLHIGIQQADADAVFAEAYAPEVMGAHQAHEVRGVCMPGLLDLGNHNPGQRNGPLLAAEA